MNSVPAIAVYVTALDYDQTRMQDPSFVSKVDIRQRAFDPVTEERIEKEARARAETYLEYIKQAAAASGVECDTVCETNDHPYDAIIKAAESKGCDLIVLHSHGRKGLAAALLGSETRKVLFYAKIPVMVVR